MSTLSPLPTPVNTPAPAYGRLLFVARCLAAAACSASLCLSGMADAADVSTQKVIFLRHGEKPAQGLGMLNCQGLNRALALPAVLQAKFGKADFAFASNPHEQKPDDGKLYNYVRPLLTIAPTAVQLGLPINTVYGFEDIGGLQKELTAPQYRNAVVLVAWEHKKIDDIVKAMLTGMGGDATAVPRWKGSDFDSIYVVTVTRQDGQARASFSLDREGLDGQATACPALPSAGKP